MRSRFAASVAVLALVLAACSSAATASPSAAGRERAPPSVVPRRPAGERGPRRA